MTALYADASALVRAYLGDEPGSAALRELLFLRRRPVITSELSLVELTRAFHAAGRAGRIADVEAVLRGVEADLSEGGAVLLVRLRPDSVLPRARVLVSTHSVGTLDAIHLAVAVEERTALGDPIVFVTRDAAQAGAARELGLDVA